MYIVIAYLILALLLLSLATGWYQPKRWHTLTDKHVKVLKLGCFFGFLVIVANIASRFL